MGEAILSSLAQLMQPQTLLLMLVGVAVGFVVGILPGLGGAVTLALMLPFAVGLEPVQAFAFLLGMLAVTSTTGDITSVLFGVPGDATAAATVLDGHPMTKRGEAGRALGAVLSASALGAVFGALVLVAVIPIVRPLVLAFGPAEFFALTILGLTFVVALSGGNVVKGLLMALFGVLVAMVGIDAQEGVPRYAFGELYLWAGIPLVPLVVGLFGGAELLQLMLARGSIGGSENRRSEADAASEKVRATGMAALLLGVRDTLSHWWLVVRSGAIGVAIGMMPGVGGSVAQFLVYGHAQQTSRNPEQFGHGAVEGVIAAGASNNAKDSGSLVPTVAFGIPGGAATAVLLSAFLVVGLDPGPEMLTTDLDVTLSMAWVVILANIIAVSIALVTVRHLVKLTLVPSTYIVPALLVLLTVGTYTASNNFADVLVMLAAAAIGVVCVRWNWPRVPFLLAVVLGSIAERYLFLSVSLYGFEWLTRPAVLVIAAIIILTLVQSGRRRLRATRTSTTEGAAK
ncbi:tripartite tricarboxylate transporter permease [Pseudonocardia sp. NPDC046786]|uniref:tripartite tricarboxylate transporter permease n=1 Tax=Pseudonocardia sp. NPDC046786 TaxID=3155471 RepID=UPI0033CBD120